MFQSILVPVDGSPFSEHALPLALGIAQAARAKVEVALVHVPAVYYEEAVSHSEMLELEAKYREQEYLDGLRRRLPAAAEVTINTHRLEGIIPDTLGEEIVEKGIDLVVMCTHERMYLSRAILGSVADRLLRHSNIPVVLIHPTVTPAMLDRPTVPRKVLVCLDGTAAAEAILDPVMSLGQLSPVTYRLLQVVLPSSHYVGPFTSRTEEHDQTLKEQASRNATIYLEKVAQRLASGRSIAETKVVVSSTPDAAILDDACAAGCDLIAMATHGRGGLVRMLMGSVADKVIRNASCPVLVYHPGNE